MQQLKRLSRRQQIAIKYPFDSTDKNSMKIDHQGDVGKFDTLFTVDIRTHLPEKEFLDRYEWHVSVCLDADIITLPNQPQKFPFVPLLMWSEEVWEDAMQICQELLSSVGERYGNYWTGEPFSLHFRKPLRRKEMNLLLELMK